MAQLMYLNVIEM